MTRAQLSYVWGPRAELWREPAAGGGNGTEKYTLQGYGNNSLHKQCDALLEPEKFDLGIQKLERTCLSRSNRRSITFFLVYFFNQKGLNLATGVSRRHSHSRAADRKHYYLYSIKMNMNNVNNISFSLANCENRIL